MQLTHRSLHNTPPGIKVQPEPSAELRRRAVVVLTCIALYVAIYSALSWRGSYIGHNQGGGDNRDTWFPAYCGEPYISPAGRQKVRLTALGWVFFPPMLIDQLAIHRTRFDVE